MSADVPPDFEKPWEMADFVLNTEDSDGKELHSNKSILAIFSPYFRALFFHGFKEKNDSVVTLKCGFDTMKEILKHIHHVDFDYSLKPRQFPAQTLIDLYRVADLYDFPTVRKICMDQIKDTSRTDTVQAAAELNLRDVMMEILERQTASEVEQFLQLNIDYRFSKKEFLTLYGKITGRSLSEPTTASSPKGFGLNIEEIENTASCPTRRLNLEEITVEIGNPRIDLTKPWEMSDVAISTHNSLGRLLYTNKTVIDTVSPTIRKISTEDSRLKETIDVEYTTIKEMLFVIHHCDTNYQDPSRVLHPALLHSMYRAASEDELDFPMNRDWCVAKLLEQKSADSWEVMTNLHITPKNYYLSNELWREMIFREDEHLSYRKGDEIVIVTPCQHEPLFRSDFVLELIDRLTSSEIPRRREEEKWKKRGRKN